MGWIAPIVVIALMLLGVGAMSSGLVLYLSGRTMRRIREQRKAKLGRHPLPPAGTEQVPLPPPQQMLPDPADMTIYPTRLEGLELQLAERIRSVVQQRSLLLARLQELQGKPGREDLSRKYTQDAGMLERRMEGMRRVLGQVWKTRAVLLLRVHLATTARQKPQLEDLPDPEYRPVSADTTDYYHAAAAAVRRYLGAVDQQRGRLAATIPRPPVEGLVDAAIRETVEQEYSAVEQSYRQLRDQMDRLSDNLTWLGDHLATVRVVEDDGGSMAPEEGAARLLEEIGVAVEEVDRLARSVDPHLVDLAVDNLTEDISRLEKAGEEAAAEAAAALEVESLLRQTGA